MKGQNILKFMNKENSTWCVKLMRKQDNIISLPRDKMSYRSWENWLCENTLTIDFGRQKRNQIQQYITANIWENNKNLKRGTHGKINLKTRNLVIPSPREKNITALRKEDESRKSKRRKNKPIILRSVVFQLCYISGHFGSFPSGFVVTNRHLKAGFH